jgi:hypothetical protein
MFKIGDYVSYQTRNKNARERFALSFHLHSGHVISITDSEIQVERYNSQDNKEFFRSVTVFRQLRNGYWIARSQTHDDPKGRLHLKSAKSDDYCDWLKEHKGEVKCVQHCSY